MTYCLFIPSTPNHIMNVEEILSCYMNGTILPDEIVISLSYSNDVDDNIIINLENKFDCKDSKIYFYRK